VRQVEREGLSVRHPCKPLLIATYNPEEGTLRDHLLDRIAINLSADREWTDFKDRVDAVQRATEYQQTPEKMCEDMEEQSEGARTAITFAREYIEDVRIKPAQVKYLVTEAMRGAVQVNTRPHPFPQREALLFWVSVGSCARSTERRPVESFGGCRVGVTRQAA